jgi:hypothetical protein
LQRFGKPPPDGIPEPLATIWDPVQFGGEFRGKGYGPNPVARSVLFDQTAEVLNFLRAVPREPPHPIAGGDPSMPFGIGHLDCLTVRRLV